MSEANISELVAQMRVMAAQAGLGQSDTAVPAQGADFQAVFKNAIDTVNDTQQRAGELAQAFERGDPAVELSRVMVELQKARVSFEAIAQVRTRLVSAYQEIMNMQV